MAKKIYKALEPMNLGREIRPGDTFEADPAEVVNRDVVELGAAADNAPAAPTDPADRNAAIMAAIEHMDADDAELWLKDGRPDVSALSAETGWPVSAKERDAAWAKINAGL